MNMTEVDYKKPALVGGLIAGIFPLIPFVNLCLCLWPLFGGTLAAKMLIDRSPQPLTSGDGAKVGWFAGLVGAIVCFLIQTPILTFTIGDSITTLSQLSVLPDEARVFYERLRESPVMMFMLVLFGSTLHSLFLLAFTVLGGLLGTALFERRKGAAPGAFVQPYDAPPYHASPSGTLPYGGAPDHASSFDDSHDGPSWSSSPPAEPTSTPVPAEPPSSTDQGSNPSSSPDSGSGSS
jgi:hypothetical protein